MLLDVHLPGGNGNGGVDVISGCAGSRRGTGAPVRFLALSVSDAAEDVIAVIRAGARGYVTKTISGDRPDHARSGGWPTGTRCSARGWRASCSTRSAPPPARSPRSTRSSTGSRAREREVMRLIARGYQYKEVAKELFISIKTVETHVSSVLRKLQLSSATSSPPGRSGRRLL